jgi:hypothetical protein
MIVKILIQGIAQVRLHLKMWILPGLRARDVSIDVSVYIIYIFIYISLCLYIYIDLYIYILIYISMYIHLYLYNNYFYKFSFCPPGEFIYVYKGLKVVLNPEP